LHIFEVATHITIKTHENIFVITQKCRKPNKRRTRAYKKQKSR